MYGKAAVCEDAEEAAEFERMGMKLRSAGVLE